MSRLIEALRKAEEQKRKEEADSKSAKLEGLSIDDTNAQNQESSQFKDQDSIDFELESTEESDFSDKSAITDNKDSDDSRHSDTHGAHLPHSSSDGFELEALEEEGPSISASDEAQTNAIPEYDDNNLANSDDDLDGVPSEVDTELNQQLEHSQIYSRRQTDTIQIDVLPQNQYHTNHRRRLFWIVLIGIALLISGTAYFFFFIYGSNENQYPSNPYPNRGFLDATRSLEATIVDSEEKANLSEGSVELVEQPNVLLKTAKNVVTTTVDSIGDSTAETIDAVNALFEDLTQIENQLPEPNQTTVLQIKRSEPVKGTSSSIAYAEDNAQGGEYSAARLEYEELLRNQPNNRLALTGLANLELKSGRKNAARQRYSQLLNIDPKNPLAQVGLIETASDYDPTLIETELKTLASLYPEHAFINFKLGNLLSSQNRWSEAKSAYEKSLEAAQKQSSNPIADYAFNLAVSLEKNLQPQQALEKYKEAKELSTSSPFSFDMRVLNNRINSLEGVN